MRTRRGPYAIIARVAARLRLVRAVRHGAATLLAFVLLAAALVLAEKAALPVPPWSVPAALGALLAVSFLASLLASLRRAPQAAEAAYLLDRRAAGAERFATYLELARDGRGGAADGFRAAIGRECAALGTKVDLPALVPLRFPRWMGPAAALAALVAAAALVAPDAVSEKRRRLEAQGGALRAAAGGLDGLAGGGTDALRAEILSLARALEEGRIDDAALRRALARARRTKEAALGLEAVPDALLEAARTLPALERLARSLDIGAPPDEAPRAAAELAAGSGGGPGAGATREKAAALLESHPALRPLAEAIREGSPARAAALARRLAFEVASVDARLAALAGATARLEAAARKLGIDAEREEAASGPAPSAEPAPGPAPEGLHASAPGRALPPRLEDAVRRYFKDQEIPQ